MAPHRKPGPVFSKNILSEKFLCHALCTNGLSYIHVFSLIITTSIICTRRMDSTACWWERFLSWCMYFICRRMCFHTVWFYCFHILYSLLLLIPPLSTTCLLFSLCSQLLFVVGFTVFLANCVDYDILFANKFVNHTDSSKVTLPDAIIPVEICSAQWV